MRDFRSHYSRFLKPLEEKGLLHFVAHSHHPWPDVSREAMLRYWDDSARLMDDKWSLVFNEVVPAAQQKVADILRMDAAGQVVFSASTHDLVSRLLSSLDLAAPIRILTTDGEFHSFSRQWKRLAELDNVSVDVVPCQPFESLHQRLCDALKKQTYELFYLSEVFYDSAWRISGLDALANHVPKETLWVLDAYHSFMALPQDLSSLQDRLYCVAGGYKYAQAGEGACFMTVPRNCQLRPLFTGWFAAFGELSDNSGQVSYSADAMRFAGGTFDPVGVYRFLAVQEWLDDIGLSVADVDAHVKHCQQQFLDALAEKPAGKRWLEHMLMGRHLDQQGHFFVFQHPEAEKLAGKLRQQGVLIDRRGERLRFGFGLYHHESQVRDLVARMEKAI